MQTKIGLTGLEYMVATCAEAEYEGSAKWLTYCTTHGAGVCSRTKKLALEAVDYPDFCDECSQWLQAHLCRDCGHTKGAHGMLRNPRGMCFGNGTFHFCRCRAFVPLSTRAGQ